MSDPQKQHLFNLLMEGIYEREIGPLAYREMVAMTTRDLDKIEPVIDEFLKSAFRDGASLALRTINTEEGALVLPVRQL